MKSEIVRTLDGSDTLYNSQVDDHYHSINGAIGESKHIFISAGLLSLEKDVLSVFELGFGTGLNALLTAFEAGKNNLIIHYSSIEKYPLDNKLAARLNYPGIIGGDSGVIYNKIIEAPWDVETAISPNFYLEKIKGGIEEFITEKMFDLVYFDAFGPEKQPEMWSGEIISKISSMMKPASVFVTYSSRGELKRLLKSLNFTVKHLPGPPGKREFTRAIKEIM